MNQVLDVRVAQNGRMVLPKSVREALGISDGGAVVLSIGDDAVTLTSMRQSVRRAQDLYRRHASVDLSVGDFLRDRRDEAAREDQD